jgi:hypothetical protein
MAATTKGLPSEESLEQMFLSPANIQDARGFLLEASKRHCQVGEPGR